MNRIVAACERERAWMLELIRELVACESPSDDPAALATCASLLARRATDCGASVGVVGENSGAPHVVARWIGGGPAILFLGHFDTVWPVGQIARMPVRETSGRLYGPGVLDMKSGLAIGLVAMRALIDTVDDISRPRVTLLATSDEEIGSRSSRSLVEELARKSAAVLVLEPALPGGGVKTARKGVGDFTIDIDGVAAHAGIDPGAGASAVHELARQILKVTSLADPSSGTTVNVGVVEGGTRTNVVAEHARARVDVRVASRAEAERFDSTCRALASVDPRVRLNVTGGFGRPPMERTPGVAHLYALARDVAAKMGQELAEGATGGASDGNFTAALGVPTLDGLGAVGGGAHALDEHVEVAELSRRAALVAGLAATIT